MRWICEDERSTAGGTLWESGDFVGDVTSLLNEVREGRSGAHEQLVALVYEELRLIAGRRATGRSGSETMQPTALVNEAYLRLFHGVREPRWVNRRHFFFAAARAMRDVLYEQARQRGTQRRGGHMRRIPFDERAMVADSGPEDVISIAEAIDRLGGLDERAHRVVMLRYFAGMGNDEVARVLDVSNATVRRDWDFAKAWLLGDLARSGWKAKGADNGLVAEGAELREEP